MTAIGKRRPEVTKWMERGSYKMAAEGDEPKGRCQDAGNSSREDLEGGSKR